MTRLTVRDVMTTEVVTARDDAPFKEVARLLEEHGVSALPVLDEGDRLAGRVGGGSAAEGGVPRPAGQARSD